MTWQTPTGLAPATPPAPAAIPDEVGYTRGGAVFYYPHTDDISIRAMREMILALWVQEGGYEDDIIVRDKRPMLQDGKDATGMVVIELRPGAPGYGEMVTDKGNPSNAVGQGRWKHGKLSVMVNRQYRASGHMRRPQR